jgi:predicted Zn-dependent peptidase
MTSASLHTLPNGVRVVCDPMPGLETVALSVVAGRGARSEDAAHSGWSHLLEHMVFKGAGQRSARDIVEVIEAAGGQINAATGYERTSFQVRALKGGLDLGVSVVADLMLRPTLDAADLAREKLVVAQEIAEAADTPDDLVFELAQEAAWGGSALGRPILGSRKSIGVAQPETLGAWRGALYGAGALVVSAAGAVEEGELLALAEQAFGHLPPGAAAPEPAAAAFSGGHVAKTKKLEQAHVVLLLPSAGARDDDYFAHRLFAEALGGGMSSRLFQEAREKLGLAYAIDAWSDAYSDCGTLGVYAGCAAGDAVELAKVAAREILALVERVDEAELKRAKAQLKAHMFMSREAPAARAETAAGQTLLFDRLFAPGEVAEAIDSVGPADFKRLGAAYLSCGHAATAVLGGRAAAEAGPAFERALFGAA